MPGSVRVSVLEVLDLPLPLVGRTVQVRVTMGMKEYKTKPVRAHGGKTPPWNADFAFPVLNLRDKLVVLIVGNRGETMTKAEIEVSSIVQKGYRDEFVPLQGGGRIHLKLSFVLSEEERRRIESMRVTKKQPPSPQQPEPVLEEPTPPVSVPVPPPVTLPLLPPPPPSLTITEIVDEEDKENEGRGARPGRRIPKGLARREQGRAGEAAEAAGKAAVAAAEGSGENVEAASRKVEIEAGDKKEKEGRAQDDDDARIADGEVAAPATPPQQEAAVSEREPEGMVAADGAGDGEEGRDVNGAEDAAEVENFLEKEMGESWMDEWIRDKPGEEEAKSEVVTAELGAGGKAQEGADGGVEVNAGVDEARDSGRSEVGAGESVEEQGSRLEEEKQAVANELTQEARDGLEESDGDDDSVSFEDQIDAVQRRWLMYADTMAVQQGEAQAKDVGMQDQDHVKAVDEGKGKAGAVQEHVQAVEERGEEADEVPEVRETNEAGWEGGDEIPEVPETKEARGEEAGEVPEFQETKEGRREESDKVPEFRETNEARVGEADNVPAFPETNEATIAAPEFRETNQARIEEADAVVPEFSQPKDTRAGEAEVAPEFRGTTQARIEEADVDPEFSESKEARAGEAEDAPEFPETNQSRVEEADDDASKFPEREEAGIGGADDTLEFRETRQARTEEADNALESAETNQAQQVRQIPVQILAGEAAAGDEEQEAVEEAYSVPVPVRSDEDAEGGKDSYHDVATTVDKRMVEETPTVTRATAQDELPPATAKSKPASPPAAESGKQRQQQEEHSSKPASAKGKGEARHPNVGGIIAHFLGGFAIVAGAAAVLWSVGSRKYHVVAEGETFHTFAPPNSSSLQNSAFCKLNPGVCESSKVYSGQRLRLP